MPDTPHNQPNRYGSQRPSSNYGQPRENYGRAHANPTSRSAYGKPSQSANHQGERAQVAYPGRPSRNGSYQHPQGTSRTQNASRSQGYAPQGTPVNQDRRSRSASDGTRKQRPSYSQQRRTNTGRAGAGTNKRNAVQKNPETAMYNSFDRYSQAKKARKKKNPFAIGAAVVLLVAIAVGIYLFINPPVYNITVNGATHTVNRGCTIDTILEEGYAEPTPGNLLAIDGSLLEEGKGDRFAATVNGKETNDGNTELGKDAVVEITDGADVTETFQTTVEEVPYKKVEDDNYWAGSLHVYTKGENGERTTKTGDISGIQITEDTKPVVNEGYHIYTADTGDDKVIALTFDDGPWDTTTEQILDILKENGAKATFFTIGEQISSHKDTVKRAAKEGHQICTHTWDHASGSGNGVDLTLMSADEQIEEIQKGMEAISEVTGEEASKVIRAPGGNFHGDIIWTLQPYITAEAGWNVDTEDWRLPGADTIAQRILSAKSGDVVLMHDGGGDRSQTVAALRQALPQLVEQGYKFVTIDELLAYGMPSE